MSTRLNPVNLIGKLLSDAREKYPDLDFHIAVLDGVTQQGPGNLSRNRMNVAIQDGVIIGAFYDYTF